MSGGSSKSLAALTALAVLLTLGVLWWRFGGSGSKAGDWQSSEDASHLRLELASWIQFLQKQPPRDLPDVIARRCAEDLPAPERAALTRQTALAVSRIIDATPVEVTRYRDGDVLRARWQGRDGTDIVLLFHSPPGHPTPRLLRTW